MDRQSQRFHRWRVDLPLSVRSAEAVSRAAFRMRLRPAVSARLGLAGFFGGGAMVVVFASLLALSV